MRVSASDSNVLPASDQAAASILSPPDPLSEEATMTTTSPPFDAVAYKAATRAQWDAAADAWHAWGPVLERWLGPATDLMLDLAGVSPGDRVLDVAAGAGGQTLSAARRVGPAGAVLATDISADDPRPRRGRRPARRRRERPHPGHRRRGPRRRPRDVRRGHLARRPDLPPRPAARPRRDAPRAPARRAGGGGRLLDARAQRLLLHPGRDHPPPGRAAAARPRAARAVQPRGPGRARVRAARGRLPATSRPGSSRRR